jgi:septum formation protein
VRIVLASASPARLATLRAAGLQPEVIVSGVDETVFTSADPATRATDIATAKATAVAAIPHVRSAELVIGCDSMLVLDGVVYGKPVDAEDATQRWRRMRGRSGVLVTGHCVIAPRDDRVVTAAAETRVHFAGLSDDEIDAYVATGEPLNVAGAFTVDGLGGAFVTGIEGDHHNVVGISLPVVRDLVARLGWTWPEVWAQP